MNTAHGDSPTAEEQRNRFLSRHSVIEMRARERARSLLDPGSFRELLDPFERLESPWLPMQGIVPESDDGVIVARGLLDGKPALIMAIEGAFQGGGMGEVSATKIAGALAMARNDCKNGHPILPVLLLETGGVRLQEANLGEAAVAEIHAEIVALRRLVPVIGVITGMIGCFGGMSITAGLCSYLVAFPQARLELNGPEVIEQEAGIDELDASDKRLIWTLMGGEQRFATGFVDALIDDDAQALRQTILSLGERGVPPQHRSEMVKEYTRRLAMIDPTAPPNAAELRELWSNRPVSVRSGFRPLESEPVNEETPLPKRGRTWFEALANDAPPVDSGRASILVADVAWDGDQVRLLSIVPDSGNRFPRARHGELGLDEGWTLARNIRDAIAADRSGAKRPIIAIVDVQSQAYGRTESLLGIHLSLAAAADAYATARMAGHPVVALIVGTALSGGLLGHGDQAHRLLALDDPHVVVQAMRKQSAARVTRRSVEELDELGKTVIPMSYDIRQFAKLGLLHELIAGIDADAPTAPQIARVKDRIVAAIADIRENPGDLTSRLNNPDAKAHRVASIEVRRRLQEQWNS